MDKIRQNSVSGSGCAEPEYRECGSYIVNPGLMICLRTHLCSGSLGKQVPRQGTIVCADVRGHGAVRRKANPFIFTETVNFVEQEHILFEILTCKERGAYEVTP